MNGWLFKMIIFSKPFTCLKGQGRNYILKPRLPVHRCFFHSIAHLESVAKLSQTLLGTRAMVCNTQRAAIFTLPAECHHPMPHYATNASLSGTYASCAQ